MKYFVGKIREVLYSSIIPSIRALISQDCKQAGLSWVSQALLSFLRCKRIFAKEQQVEETAAHTKGY